MAVLGSEGRPVPVGDNVGDPQAASTMRAVVRDAYGPADVLRLERVPRPAAGAGQVVVKVHSAGLDRGAWHLMTGRPHLLRLVFGLRRPRNRVLGREVAGTVVEVGPAVEGFSVGDEVFGIAEGSFAEYVTARVDKLAHKPVGTSFEQVAVSVSALTALQAVDAARIRSGQKVLVTGASGGVGSFAVQIARSLGAHVTGVCSTAKTGFVLGLGADHVVDYTRDDFADGQHRYDVVLDIAGNPDVARLRRALTPTGTAVIVGGEEGGSWTGGLDRHLRALALSTVVRQRLTMLTCKERARDLERLAELMEAGSVTSSIDRTYPLEEAAEAMRHLEAGRVRGKVAVVV